MVGIECNGAVFLTSFQEGPHQKFSFKDFSKILQSKMANCTIADIVNFLCYYWQTLSNSFLVFSM